MNMKDGLKRIVIFSSMLIGIYLLFSIGCVATNLYYGLMISKNLQKNFWNGSKKEEGQYVIGIISPNRRGEMNQAIMIKESAEKMGYLPYVYAVNDLDMEMFIPAKYINTAIVYILDYLFKTDFHLAMSFHVNLGIPKPKIMYISVPEEYLKNKLPLFPAIKNYNNFLDINLLNTQKEMMKEILGKEVLSIYGLVGIPANKYHNSERKRLVMFGSLWGRDTDGLYQAMNMLSMQDYMYFVENPLLLLNSKYSQKFTRSADSLSDLQSVLNDYGIAICVHSHYHVSSGIPSSRIFEIISSGAIAISDKNPFVVKYFGDNVLYFDPNLSADEIFKQIDDHVKWVQNNPKEADKMAQNAHKILQDNFTTEIFIKNMLNWYKQQKNKKS